MSRFLWTKSSGTTSSSAVDWANRFRSSSSRSKLIYSTKSMKRWKRQDYKRPSSTLLRWRSTTPFATATQRSATARCCWISVRAPRTFFSLNQEEFFCGASRWAAARSPPRSPGSSTNHLPRRKLARSGMALWGWAAHMPNLPIPTLGGFRKSRAAP